MVEGLVSFGGTLNNVELCVTAIGYQMWHSKGTSNLQVTTVHVKKASLYGKSSLSVLESRLSSHLDHGQPIAPDGAYAGQGLNQTLMSKGLTLKISDFLLWQQRVTSDFDQQDKEGA